MNRLVILLAVILTSCASDTDYAVRPHQEGERIRAIEENSTKILEVSFIAPKETGWVRKPVIDSIIILNKNGTSPEENQEIEAYINDRDTLINSNSDFLQKRKQTIQEYYNDSQTYRLQGLDTKTYPHNSQCVRTYILLEDARGAKKAEPRKFIEQHALSCNFPTHQRMGFEIRLYQKYYEQNRDVQFLKKADALFDSVQIVDRPPGWLWRRPW